MGANVIGQRPEVHQAQKPLLDWIDLAWILALMALGLALRLLYFSGFGLADDQIFRGNIAFILNNRTFTGDNIAYRITWLIPAALFCKLFGLTELGMIVPLTATATRDRFDLRLREGPVGTARGPHCGFPASRSSIGFCVVNHVHHRYSSFLLFCPVDPLHSTRTSA